MAPGLDPLQGKSEALRRGLSLQVAHQPGNSPTLVFLHGALGNRFNWRSQVEFAVAQGWECLAYDLAGHGQSSAYKRYSIGRHCRDLKRLLKLRGIACPLLVAHSYGVPLALEWSRRWPVRGLVLIAGGTHGLDPWWEQPLMRFMRAGGRQLFGSLWIQTVNRNWLSGDTHPAAARLMEESPIPVELEPYRSIETFWGYNFHRRPDSKRVFQIPALILSGGQDPMFTQAMGETLAKSFQNGRHHHFRSRGHLLMAEEPETVNQAIAEWITSEGLDQPGRT